MLINLYILSLVLGAVLLGASLFLGEKRVDADDQTRAHDDTTRASQFGQLDGVAVATTSREPCDREGSGPSSFRFSA